MRQQTNASRHGPCLDETDFYNYVTGNTGERPNSELARHLSACATCSEELAGLLQLLHPDPEEAEEPVAAVTDEEIEETLALIKKAGGKAKPPARGVPLYAWAAAAAVAVAAVGLSALMVHRYVEGKKSQAFYDQARAALQQGYVPLSLHGLRAELPFPETPRDRDSDPSDALNQAERLFYQALGAREGMVEANLGLGFVLLNKTQFPKARMEFQKVLIRAANNPRALLGRGVAAFEEGLASKDPAQRENHLQRALADFESLLRADPASNEALFNRSLTLYELGRHKDALEEIDRYLSRDPGSIWSERLRALQLKIRATRSELVEGLVIRAALTRDPTELESLARQAPYQVPAEICQALRRGMEARAAQAGIPDSASMNWVAEILESAYRAVTGDGSYRRLIDFHAGLSPPQRRAKKSLDARLQQLIHEHREGNFQTVLQHTAGLRRGFERLRDHWQLVNLHHLRGNCYYYNKADFTRAAVEYREMLRAAESAGAPDLIARALGALASVLSNKRKFDEALACLDRMKELASRHLLDPWKAYAHQYAGNVNLRLNRLDDSLGDYTSALTLAYRLNHEQLVVVTLENLGEVMERLGKLGEAEQFFDRSLLVQERFAGEGNDQDKFARLVRRLNILCKKGYLALRARRLASAEKHFRQALDSTPARLRELRARIEMGLAQVCLEAKRFGEAERQISASRAIAVSGEFPELEWQVHYLSGILRKQRGDTNNALADFQRSTRSLEKIRRDISSDELRRAFLTRRFDPYREAVSLLYRHGLDAKAALQSVESSKSAALREYLDARRRWEPGHAIAPADTPWALPKGVAALEYFFLPDGLLLFLSWESRVEVIALGSQQADMEEQVQRYHEAIKSNAADAFRALSQALYDALVDPALKLLPSEDIHTLAILPDGPLHTLPFGGMEDSSGFCLLEKFALVYAPSRSILNHSLARSRGGAAARQLSILLVDGAAELPGAAEELAYLAALYAPNARLVGSREAGSIGRMASESDIIHFAGHAELSGGKPRLLLQALPAAIHLDASTIGAWKLPRNRLVTLAGCSTGIGPSSEGEAPWGLVPAFLNAGAPAIVFSLLPVDDVSARDLARHFYDLLARGSVSKAKALQQAQLSMLRETGRSQEPRSWLPFVLLGDPR